MTAIACIDKNNGIGRDGKLLISIPEDMNFFKETTKDSIVVMGRKTLFSFKEKKPLKNRINVVFTNDSTLKEIYKDSDNIYFISKINELTKIEEKYPEKKVYVIGGSSIYNMLIDFCSECLITKINFAFKSDTFFPNLEEHRFIIKEETEEKVYKDYTYKFIKYVKSRNEKNN